MGTLLVLRLIPLVPFSLMCFVCGLARVPVRRYTWTTLVGMLPQLSSSACSGRGSSIRG